jgi:hypothetical protein
LSDEFLSFSGNTIHHSGLKYAFLVKGFGQHLKTNIRPGLSNMKNSSKNPYFTVTSLANLIYFGQQW